MKTKTNSIKHYSDTEITEEVNRRKAVNLKQELEQITGLSFMAIDAKKAKSPKKIKSVKGGKVKKSMRKNTSKKIVRIVNEVPLKDQLIKIAADGQIRTIKDFVVELETVGWKTTSTDPYTVVAAALAKQVENNTISRLSKGKYQFVAENEVMVEVDVEGV